MKVTRRNSPVKAFVEGAGLLAQGDRPSRSTGLHLSDIYHELDAVVNPKRGDLSADDMDQFASGGFLFEYAMAQAYKQRDACRYQQLGEFSRDGIAGTPDLLDIQEQVVIDFKAKWMSTKKLGNFEHNFFKELCQNKGYCYMLGWVRGLLVIYFVNGDWAPPKPQVVEIGLEYTRLELDENWHMMTAHAKQRGWL